MCGRYTIRELELLRAGLGIIRINNIDDFVERRIIPNFNAGPAQKLPIIRTGKDGDFKLVLGVRCVNSIFFP